MPLKLVAPINKEFILTETDKKFENDGEPTRICVRQVSQEGIERRNNLYNEYTFERTSENSERTIQKFSYEVVKRLEVYLALTSCNILDTNDKDLFRFKNDKLNMSENEFRDNWGKLDPITCNEIHEKVVEVNPLWSLSRV